MATGDEQLRGQGWKILCCCVCISANLQDTVDVVASTCKQAEGNINPVRGIKTMVTILAHTAL